MFVLCLQKECLIHCAVPDHIVLFVSAWVLIICQTVMLTFKTMHSWPQLDRGSSLYRRYLYLSIASFCGALGVILVGGLIIAWRVMELGCYCMIHVCISVLLGIVNATVAIGSCPARQPRPPEELTVQRPNRVSRVSVTDLMVSVEFNDVFEGDQHPQICGVCFEECKTQTLCEHLICLSCLENWLKTGSRTCPFCRKHLVHMCMQKRQNGPNTLITV